jgi:hypothetical protein
MPNGEAEELKRALETHSVRGFPVQVPIFGKGTIIRQQATSPVRVYVEEAAPGAGGPMPYFEVKPSGRFPFKKYVQALGKSERPMNLQEWKQKYERGARTIYNVMPGTELVERLEQGGTVSEAEAEYNRLKGRGMLDANDNVLYDIFWPNQTTIATADLERGMLVQFSGAGTEEKRTMWPGRIVGFSKRGDVVYLELFTPQSIMEMPTAIALEELRKGFYSSKTFALGYGTVQAMEDKELELPAGQWDEKERQYVLKEWMDISEIEKFCKENYPEEPHCLWQSLVMYVVPLNLEGEYAGRFHPLPEKVIPADWVIRYEDIGEFMPEG